MNASEMFAELKRRRRQEERERALAAPVRPIETWLGAESKLDERKRGIVEELEHRRQAGIEVGERDMELIDRFFFGEENGK